MNDKDRSFVIRLFACVIALVFVFIILAIVGGFVTARLMHLPVDIDKFYSFLQSPFMMILNAILLSLAFDKGKKSNEDTQ